MKNYNQLIKNIETRTNPENIILEKAFTEELSSISYSNVLKYIRYAMKGVEPEYTERSRDAGERVQNHLKENLSQVTYKYQGSVMTNTHIKGASDIDLLVICNKFYSHDKTSIEEVIKKEEVRRRFNYSQIQKLEKEIRTNFYSGDALNDLRENRINSEKTLKPIYDICDTLQAKTIKITNKSLNREVDIVIANWYDNIESILKDKDANYRGVQIYNKNDHAKEKPDYPFLGIKRINERSTETNGRLKKMIRFLKNIKADSNIEIKLSSFDFNAICYDIDTFKYSNKSFYELVPVIYNQLNSLISNYEHSNNLKSVDRNEFIFRNNRDKLNELGNILSEVSEILKDLKSNIII